jgi:hypothetical protein
MIIQALKYCILLALAMFVSCASVAEYPVETEIFDEKIDTTVDSPVVKYYLEDYLKGNNNNPSLHKEIDDLYEAQNGKVPSRKDLRIISEEYSVDFAALFYVDHLYRESRNSIKSLCIFY